MNVTKTIATAVVIAASLGTSAIAQDAKTIAGAIKARQAQMTLYGHNLGILGAMAKGTIEYDAASASNAAASLAAVAKMDASKLWLPGSDNASVEGTRALPAIWQDGSDVGAKAMAMIAGAEAMEAAAGSGLDALRGAMPGVGGACGACHKAYRGPAN
ncbi:MAG: cytochrome c [Thalassovita sp.]